MSDDRPIDRRRFFREGLRELLKPLANAAEPIERALRELDSIPEPRISRSTRGAAPPAPLLRPPGALLESEFLSTCSRCGTCAEVCPANCIKLDPAGSIG